MTYECVYYLIRDREREWPATRLDIIKGVF